MEKTVMLKKNYEFKNVLSKGKFYIGENLEIVIVKNAKKINFLGIAISTKNGKAFQRNRIKRLIREGYRYSEKSLTSGNSIIVLIRKKTDIRNIQYKDVIKDMENIFKKAKIVKREEEI